MDFSVVILVLWAVSLVWYRRAATQASRRIDALEEDVKLLKDQGQDAKLKSVGARRSVGTAHFNS